MAAERVPDDGPTMTDTLSAKAARLAARWKEYLRSMGVRVSGAVKPLPAMVQE